VILPGWRYSTRALRLLLREVAPAWGAFQILDAALYLGTGMVNLGLSLSWRSAARKYEDRLHYVRHLGLGLSAHCLLYNIFAVSTIMYVAQVRPLPQTLLDLEDELLPKIIPARYKWIPAAALHNINAILPFRHVPRSLTQVCTSAALRTAARLQDNNIDFSLAPTRAQINNVGQLSHVFPSWLASSCFVYLEHISMLHINIIATGCLRTNVQAELYWQIHGLITQIPYAGNHCYTTARVRRLEDPAAFKAITYLAYSFQMFFSNQRDACSAAQATIVIAHALISSHQAVLNSVLKLWLNAWPLRHVFEDSKVCLACRHWLSVPSVRHLSFCPVVANIFRAHRLRAPRDVRHLLMIDCTDFDTIRTHARVLHALHLTFCQVRRQAAYDFVHLCKLHFRL